MRVLVVDDEEPFRILMESELGRLGHAVQCVESGEEALQAFAAHDVEVVLLDLKMPGLGGMETLKRMREAGVTAEVIILTGHPDIDDAIQAMKLGAYDYLTSLPGSQRSKRSSSGRPRKSGSRERTSR